MNGPRFNLLNDFLHRLKFSFLGRNKCILVLVDVLLILLGYVLVVSNLLPYRANTFPHKGRNVMGSSHPVSAVQYEKGGPLLYALNGRQTRQFPGVFLGQRCGVNGAAVNSHHKWARFIETIPGFHGAHHGLQQAAVDLSTGVEVVERNLFSTLF